MLAGMPEGEDDDRGVHGGITPNHGACNANVIVLFMMLCRNTWDGLHEWQGLAKRGILYESEHQTDLQQLRALQHLTRERQGRELAKRLLLYDIQEQSCVDRLLCPMLSSLIRLPSCSRGCSQPSFSVRMPRCGLISRLISSSRARRWSTATRCRGRAAFWRQVVFGNANAKLFKRLQSTFVFS